MAGFGRSFERAFGQALPMGFRAHEQSLRTDLLQGQLDEQEYARETRRQVGEAYEGTLAAAQPPAPVAESQPTTVQTPAGFQTTERAPTAAAMPARPAMPEWAKFDAMREMGRTLMTRGQYQQGTAMMQQADLGFERYISDSSKNMLRAIESGNLKEVQRIYDALPDGMRVANLELGKNGKFNATLIDSDGTEVKRSFGRDELRELAVGLTAPEKIQEMRDSAMKREAERWANGVGAALSGNQELARKLLGGDVKIEDFVREDGVRDQRLTLPDGRMMTRSQFEKVAPWAIQEQGLKVRKGEADIRKTEADIRESGAKTNYYDAMARYTDAGRGKGLSADGQQTDTDGLFTENYAKFRKEGSDIFKDGENLPKDRTPTQASDLYAEIMATSLRAQQRGYPGLPGPTLVAAIRAGGDAIALDRTATAKRPDGSTVQVAAWVITDPRSGAKFAIPAVGHTPDPAGPGKPKPDTPAATGLPTAPPTPVDPTSPAGRSQARDQQLREQRNRAQAQGVEARDRDRSQFDTDARTMSPIDLVRKYQGFRERSALTPQQLLQLREIESKL